MSKKIPDFIGFPLDNSSTTNLKYDIIASKFMTGIENHQRRKTTAPSFGILFYLIGAVLELVVTLFFLLFSGLRWIWKRC